MLVTKLNHLNSYWKWGHRTKSNGPDGGAAEAFIGHISRVAELQGPYQSTRNRVGPAQSSLRLSTIAVFVISAYSCLRASPRSLPCTGFRDSASAAESWQNHSISESIRDLCDQIETYFGH